MARRSKIVPSFMPSSLSSCRTSSTPTRTHSSTIVVLVHNRSHIDSPNSKFSAWHGEDRDDVLASRMLYLKLANFLLTYNIATTQLNRQPIIFVNIGAEFSVKAEVFELPKTTFYHLHPQTFQTSIGKYLHKMLAM